MTMTLTFTLPDEEAEAQQAMRAGQTASALARLREDVRNKLKHGHKFASADEVLHYVYKELHDLDH